MKLWRDIEDKITAKFNEYRDVYPEDCESIIEANELIATSLDMWVSK